MKYIVDQDSAGIVEDLRKHGYVCETATKLILGHDDSRFRVGDPRIIAFLEKHRDEYTLLTGDDELVRDCTEAGLRVLRLPKPLPRFDEIRLLLSGAGAQS